MEKIVVNLKPKTQRFYRQMTEHYLLPYLGEHEPIKNIDAEGIVDMMNAMRRAGYAEQTIDHVFTVGKTVFAYARKWRKIMFNPFDDVDPPNVRSVDPTPLSEAEAAALRWAVEDHRLRALYELALALGLRKSELLGLTIEGLDLKEATITIGQQVLNLDDGVSIEPYTKNDEPRTLPLTPRLVALLEIRLAQLEAERGEDWEEYGLLFPSERDTPMSERNLDRHFKGACVRAKIRLRDTGQKRADGTPIYTSDLKFHHLRHTCLSWLGDAGASDKIIKAIAGHADENVTDRYVHVSLEAMREVVERIEAENSAVMRATTQRLRGLARRGKKVLYPHFYPHQRQNRPFWASKREGVLPSLKPWSRWSGLNRRPAVYETAALPLSYTGTFLHSPDLL